MHAYVERCTELARELVESLTEQEVETLRSRLEGATKGDWTAWRKRHAETIAQFVEASPSQRNKRKAWKDARLFLCLAGFQHCVEAGIVLEEIDLHFLSPGGPYRKMAAKCCETVSEP